MKQISDKIPNDKIRHFEPHRFTIVFWKWLSGNRSKFCMVPVTNTHKNPIDSQCNDWYPGRWWNFKRSIKNDTLLYILLFILNLKKCKFQFSSITLHVRVALKESVPFQANQNVKYKCFDLALQIFHNFWIVYVYINCLVWSEECLLCLDFLILATTNAKRHQWPHLRTWFNCNHSMDK